VKTQSWPSKAKKFASLAAAGAGAVSLTASKAEASIILSPDLNVTIGFTGSSVGRGVHTAASHFFNTFASGPSFGFKAIETGNGSLYGRRLEAAGNAAFETVASIITPFPADAVMNSLSGSGKLIAARHWSNVSSSVSGAGFPFNDAFYLFRFDNGGVKYGWLEASLALSFLPNADPAAGPSLTVIRYAFDNTGNSIAAGQTDLATPEPASLAETGIGALLLGAEGLRRWRKARKAA